MSEQEKLAYLKALMYITLSDDKVDDDEIQYFDRIGTAYGLSVYQVNDLKKSVMNREETIEEILSCIVNRSTKLTLLYDLLAMCYANGNYSLVEKQGLKNICEIMHIETSKLNELESAMEEQVALQAKINNILER